MPSLRTCAVVLAVCLFSDICLADTAVPSPSAVPSPESQPFASLAAYFIVDGTVPSDVSTNTGLLSMLELSITASLAGLLPSETVTVAGLHAIPSQTPSPLPTPSVSPTSMASTTPTLQSPSFADDSGDNDDSSANSFNTDDIVFGDPGVSTDDSDDSDDSDDGVRRLLEDLIDASSAVPNTSGGRRGLRGFFGQIVVLQAFIHTASTDRSIALVNTMTGFATGPTFQAELVQVMGSAFGMAVDMQSFQARVTQHGPASATPSPTPTVSHTPLTRFPFGDSQEAGAPGSPPSEDDSGMSVSQIALIACAAAIGSTLVAAAGVSLYRYTQSVRPNPKAGPTRLMAVQRRATRVLVDETQGQQHDVEMGGKADELCTAQPVSGEKKKNNNKKECSLPSLTQPFRQQALASASASADAISAFQSDLPSSTTNSSTTTSPTSCTAAQRQLQQHVDEPAEEEEEAEDPNKGRFANLPSISQHRRVMDSSLDSGLDTVLGFGSPSARASAMSSPHSSSRSPRRAVGGMIRPAAATSNSSVRSPLLKSPPSIFTPPSSARSTAPTSSMGSSPAAFDDDVYNYTLDGRAPADLGSSSDTNRRQADASNNQTRQHADEDDEQEEFAPEETSRRGRRGGPREVRFAPMQPEPEVLSPGKGWDLGPMPQAEPEPTSSPSPVEETPVMSMFEDRMSTPTFSEVDEEELQEGPTQTDLLRIQAEEERQALIAEQKAKAEAAKQQREVKRHMVSKPLVRNLGGRGLSKTTSSAVLPPSDSHTMPGAPEDLRHVPVSPQSNKPSPADLVRDLVNRIGVTSPDGY